MLRPAPPALHISTVLLLATAAVASCCGPGAGSATAAPVSAAPAAKAQRLPAVPTGPFFNNPRGSKKAKFRIERQVVNAIRRTPKGGYIRIALYSFDRMPVANALLAAKRRGVHVQLLLNDHQDTKAMKVLRARLGTNRRSRDFIYKCRSSCRGTVPDRNLHSKFYTFSRAGRSRHVLMVGSANMMLNADIHQWNDLFVTTGKKRLFNQYVALFDDMRHDYQRNQPSYRFCGRPKGEHCDEAVDRFTTRVFPKRSTRRRDVVLTMLDRIQCLTPRADGSQKRTKLVLSMHTLRGQRGNYLASAIRQKYAEGCDFRVNYGLIGYHTKQILGAMTARGRIPLRSTGFDFSGDREVDLYTHQKYFVIRGTYAGRPNTSLTLTGSSNWASLGTAQDEVFFTVRGAGTARRYVRNFDLMWRPGNSRAAYTTTYASFRALGRGLFSRQARQPATTVEPDGLLPPGGSWEELD